MTMEPPPPRTREERLAATRRYRTVQNAASHPEVRLASGTTGDVVILEGTAVVRDLDEVADPALDCFAGRAGWDPRHSDGNAIVEVTPQR
ncbi:MAG: hypothetical protein ABIJ75_00200, partial [Actinomycetota bacterium]